jgi:hypothetical protein
MAHALQKKRSEGHKEEAIMRIYIGGQVFSGDALQVVTAMKFHAHGADDLDLDAYVDWIVERAAMIDGIALAVEEGPLHWRAESLVNAMLDAGLAALDDVDARDSERTTVTMPVAMVQEAV